MNKNKFFEENKSILSLLLVEVVALTLFNFQSFNIVFYFAGVLIAIAGGIFIFKKTQNKKQLLPILLILLVLFFVSGIASFNSYSEIYGKFSFQNITFFLAIPSIFLLGYIVKDFKDIKTKSLLLVIGGVLAFITLLGLISTLVSYGFFYKLRFKNTPFYFYQGNSFDVTKEMYWLVDFKFEEVLIAHGSIYALLSASFLPSLMFISPKKNRNEFIIAAMIGGIGLITLFVIPNFSAIITLLIACVGAFLFKFLPNNKKVLKTAKWILVSIVAVGLIFFLIAIINAVAGNKFTGFFAKIFVNNSVMSGVTDVLSLVFKKGGENLFGIALRAENESTILLDTGILEIELLKEVGLFGAIALICFFVFMLFSLFKYMEKSKDKIESKVVFLTMILSFFIYESFSSTISPFAHKTGLLSILKNPLFILMLFIFGFIFAPESEEENK